MADMKFKFTIQPYQTDAVDSIVHVFAGQPYQDKVSYRRDIGNQKTERDLFNYQLSDEELYMGFANAPVALTPYQLLDNIRKVQAENNIRQSSARKTYVYIKSMFELNKQYGWSKFIVVVPSIAIREAAGSNPVASTKSFI